MWSANRCECLTFLPVALNPRKSLNIRSYSQGEGWGFLGQHEAGDTSARSSISGTSGYGGPRDWSTSDLTGYSVKMRRLLTAPPRSSVINVLHAPASIAKVIRLASALCLPGQRLYSYLDKKGPVP